MRCPDCPLYLRDSPGDAGLLLRWTALNSGLSPVGNALDAMRCKGGCQSFCLSVQSTIEGGACAFGGFLGENSLLTGGV
jgi:hypothetical protein